MSRGKPAPTFLRIDKLTHNLVFAALVLARGTWIVIQSAAKNPVFPFGGRPRFLTPFGMTEIFPVANADSLRPLWPRLSLRGPASNIRKNEEKMTTIIGLSGSLRKGSYNTALLHAAEKLMPEGAMLNVKTIHGIQLYNGDDEEAHGIPPPVQELKAAIAAADGLLLATPEYNNSIPGVFKNAIDWLSRPSADIPKVFGGKPVALIGASPGPYGTVLSQNAWLATLRTLGTKPWFGGRLLVANADEAFDPNGQLTDAVLKERLRKFLAGFVRFAAEERR